MSKQFKQAAVESVLPALRANRGATAKELATPSVTMTLLEREGYVQRVGKVETGKRGRPAIKWAVTDKGRKQAQRIEKAQAEVVAA